MKSVALILFTMMGVATMIPTELALAGMQSSNEAKRIVEASLIERESGGEETITEIMREDAQEKQLS